MSFALTAGELAQVLRLLDDEPPAVTASRLSDEELRQRRSERFKQWYAANRERVRARQATNGANRWFYERNREMLLDRAQFLAALAPPPAHAVAHRVNELGQVVSRH